MSLLPLPHHRLIVQRHVEVGTRRNHDAFKVRRSYTNDGNAVAVQLDAVANDRRSGSIVFHPKLMTDDHSPSIRTATRLIIRCSQQPPGCGSNTENIEDVATHNGSRIGMRDIVFEKISAVVAPSKNAGERTG